MALYTFVMDYNGGTYIAQVRASSPTIAVGKWARELDQNAVHGIRAKSKAKLIRQMKDEMLSPVTGVLNTWCVSTILLGKLALIHLVKTDYPELASRKVRSSKDVN